MNRFTIEFEGRLSTCIVNCLPYLFSGASSPYWVSIFCGKIKILRYKSNNKIEWHFYFTRLHSNLFQNRADQLLTSIENNIIITLNLSNRAISDIFCLRIMKALSKNTSITKINFQNCEVSRNADHNITDDIFHRSVILFSKTIANHPSLEDLNLTNFSLLEDKKSAKLIIATLGIREDIAFNYDTNKHQKLLS